MAQEEKFEKKVEVKEKPLGEIKKVEETEQRISEQPSTAVQPGRVEDVASKGGEAIGKGLKKVKSVVEEFTSGVSKEMKSGEPPKQEGQAQQTEYRSEQTERTQEAPPDLVLEKEKTEKKVTKEKE